MLIHFSITESIMKERDEKKIVVGDFIDRLRELVLNQPDLLNKDIIIAQAPIL